MDNQKPTRLIVGNTGATGTIFGVPEIVPGINVKETISTVKFGVNYRFGPY